MTNYKILLKDGIPCAVDVPEVTVADISDSASIAFYERDLQ